MASEGRREVRVVAVTGAARGIGHAVAGGFLSAGDRVIALDRSWSGTGSSGDDAPSARAELVEAGALVQTVDITDDASVRRAHEAAVEQFGGVDVIVNNAAMRMRDVHSRKYVEVLDTEISDWQRMLDVNVLGPMRMIKQFVPAMVARGHGAVINVSSSSGTHGMPGDNPYGASKAAVTNLSESLADELAPRGVAVHAVFPGITRTTGFDEQHALHPSTDLTGGLLVFRPESVVPLVLWLADQDVSSTGQTFAVGEWLLHHGLGPLERWLADPVSAPTPAGQGTPC